MDSYIVRIYHRNFDDIAGTVEAVETGKRTSLGGGLEMPGTPGLPVRVVELRDAQPLTQAQCGRQTR